MLPQVSVLVTNGGYGSVSQALAAGVPIVSAGLTEDKAEIGRAHRLVRRRPQPRHQRAQRGPTPNRSDAGAR